MASLSADVGASLVREEEGHEDEGQPLCAPHTQLVRWQRTLSYTIGAALFLVGIVVLGAPVLQHGSPRRPRPASLTNSLFLSSSDSPPGAVADEDVFREVTMRAPMMVPNAEAVDEWIGIAPQIDAIKFYIDGIRQVPVKDLRPVVNKLKGKKILFDVEAGGIRKFCCNSTELAQREFRKVRNFYKAGGRFSLWTMDGPFGHGLKTVRVTDSCKYESVEYTIDMIVAYAQRILELLDENGYPPVVFGLNEPVPWYRVGKWESHPKHPPNGDLAVLIPQLAKAFKQKKLPLGFFHADHPGDYGYDRSGKPLMEGGGYLKLKELQTIARDAGLRFGKYFNNAKAGRKSNAAYFDATVKDRDAFVKAAGQPDNSVFESWYKYPNQGFPLDTDYTLSWDVAHFYPKRKSRAKWAIELERKLERFEEEQSKQETG